MAVDGAKDWADAERRLHQAVAEIVGAHGVMVTKWMLGVEVLDEQGGRDMYGFASPDFRAWDSLGIVGFLDARERGAVGADAVNERDDRDG